MNNDENLPPNIRKHEGPFWTSYSDTNRPNQVFNTLNEAANSSPTPPPTYAPGANGPISERAKKVLGVLFTWFVLMKALNFVASVAAHSHGHGSILNRVLEILCFPMLLIRLRNEQIMTMSGWALVNIALPALFLAYFFVIAKVMVRFSAGRKLVGKMEFRKGKKTWVTSFPKLILLMVVYVVVYFLVI